MGILTTLNYDYREETGRSQIRPLWSLKTLKGYFLNTANLSGWTAPRSCCVGGTVVHRSGATSSHILARVVSLRGVAQVDGILPMGRQSTDGMARLVSSRVECSTWTTWYTKSVTIKSRVAHGSKLRAASTISPATFCTMDRARSSISTTDCEIAHSLSFLC